MIRHVFAVAVVAGAVLLAPAAAYAADGPTCPPGVRGCHAGYGPSPTDSPTPTGSPTPGPAPSSHPPRHRPIHRLPVTGPTTAGTIAVAAGLTALGGTAVLITRRRPRRGEHRGTE